MATAPGQDLRAVAMLGAFSDPRAAALAACRVLKLFDDLDPATSPFAVRIGINAGRAVRANVGSPRAP